MLGVGCWVLDVGCWMLDVRCSQGFMGRSTPYKNGLLSPALSSFGEEREIIQHVFSKSLVSCAAFWFFPFLTPAAAKSVPVLVLLNVFLLQPQLFRRMEHEHFHARVRRHV